MRTTTRTYSDLRQISSFTERFEYLSLRATVGEVTFGFDRYINQEFYRSREWKLARRDVIARDLGCDLGVAGYDIFDRVYIHHMNPMTAHELIDGDPSVLDPEYLICVTHNTHNAIHYGDRSLLRLPLEERKPGDTNLW